MLKSLLKSKLLFFDNPIYLGVLKQESVCDLEYASLNKFNNFSQFLLDSLIWVVYFPTDNFYHIWIFFK